MEQKEYYAFISYKREDEKWAKWLQHKLEHYKLPLNLNGRTDLPREIRPVFRDTYELNPGNLPQQIHDALAASHNLIVICSPHSAQSKWVNLEIETFMAMGKQDCIIPFVIEGSPFAKDSSEECYPPAIRNLPKDQELLGANINEMGRDAAAIKTVAQMFGLRFDSLWKRYKREQKRKRAIIIVSVILFVLAVMGVAAYIWQQNKKLKTITSRAFAKTAMQLVENGDSYRARKVALSALNLSYTSEAEEALRTACQYNTAVLTGHTASVYYVSFSPDGKQLITASDDQSIRIWDVISGKCLKKIETAYKCQAISPDGENVALTCENDIVIKKLLTGQVTNTLKGLTDCAYSVAFSPDGKWIGAASCSFDTDIRIWNAITGELSLVLQGHTQPVYSISFSPNSKFMVTTSEDKTIRVWDVHTGRILHTLTGHTGRVTSAVFSPNGENLFSTSYDGDIRVWDVSSGKLIDVFENLTTYATSLAIDPKGKYLVSQSGDHGNEICLVDASTGVLLDLKEGHSMPVEGMSFSPCGNQIASVSRDHVVRLWDVSNELLVNTFNVSGALISAEYSPDNKSILISGENSIFVLDANTGSIQSALHFYFDDSNTSYYPNVHHYSSYSPDGRLILSCFYDGSITICDAHSLQNQKVLIEEDKPVNCASFSPDAKKIVSASDDGNLRLWDLYKKKCTNVLKGHTKKVLSVKWSSDGKYIVSASADATVRIWNALSGEPLHKLIGHDDDVNSVSISSDCKYVSSASSDKTIRMWNIETGKLIKTLEGHTGAVFSVAYSPNEKYIISAGDLTVRLWETKSGKMVQSIMDNKNEDLLLSAAFSPDGRKIASVGEFGPVCTWKFISLEELINETCNRFKNNPLTQEEKRRFYME